MNDIYDITTLIDYPSIKKLAAALYKFDANQHGAAIMVGAGFSRSAARHVDGEKKLPLWGEFSRGLMNELSPNDKDTGFTDPLRVAEEYRTYFGQAALNDRIRFEINDESWRVGELHTSLLKLPWSEVLTTNWDTLLERAAKNIHGPYYTPVAKPSDLAWAPSPRIAKLHGTIGLTEMFIAAQEDYRTYPEKFAPFVNFARQVFIENELCLLGFSGDDPNFIHWAGWVRDHLANHARRIYLVGALKLTAARRKHLESMNIAPIDLWDAVKSFDDHDLRHQKATELFLQALVNESNSRIKPYKWSPRRFDRQNLAQSEFTRSFKDHEYAATLLKGQLEILQNDRESYPGWLVCPTDLRWQLKSQIESPIPNSNNINALDANARARLLYEIAWRYSITFEFIPPWLADELFTVADPDTPCILSRRQQLEVALILLKNSRWLETAIEMEKPQTQEYTNVLINILEKYSEYMPDCPAELAYYHAVIARDALDYESLENWIEKIVGEDSIWKLRRAALLLELGQVDKACSLIEVAYGELRENHRRDRYSISILSRLVWCHWLLEAVNTRELNYVSEELPDFAKNNYREWKCDPSTWIEKIRSEANKQKEHYLKHKNPIEPSFEQGRYKDNSDDYSINRDSSPFFFLDGLTRGIGMPLRTGSGFMNINLLVDSTEKLLLSGGVGVKLWDYTLAIRAASSETSPAVNDVFTRIGVASASINVVDLLIERLLKAIAYWNKQRGSGTKEQQGCALSMLRVQMEVMARLVVRASPEKAKEIFRLSVAIGRQKDFLHHWLFDSLDSLLTYSLGSIPESEQGELLMEALAFPLQSEITSGDFPRCPNIVINSPNARDSYPGIGNRIRELISAIVPIGTVSSMSALLRLLPLVKVEGFLNSEEFNEIANAIWGSDPAYKEVPNLAGILPHALLLLPAPDINQVKNLVCRHLYEHSAELLADTQKELRQFPSPEIQKAVGIYTGIAYAATNEDLHLFPTPDQAIILFDQSVVWRPQIDKDDFFGHAGTSRKQISESMGHALTYGIVPALLPEQRNIERFNQLKLFYEEVESSISVMPAFVYFSHINNQVVSVIEGIIRKSMQSPSSHEVSYAAIALIKWIESPHPISTLTLDNLTTLLLIIIESGRSTALHQLIWVSGELFKKKLLSNAQIITLTEAIPNIFDRTEYVCIDPKSREAVSNSSLRKACVELAKLIVEQSPSETLLGDILKKQKLILYQKCVLYSYIAFLDEYQSIDKTNHWHKAK